LLKSGKKRAFTGPKTNKLNQPLFIPDLSPLVNIKKKKNEIIGRYAFFPGLRKSL
jgi:hypothetical protein